MAAILMGKEARSCVAPLRGIRPWAGRMRQPVGRGTTEKEDNDLNIVKKPLAELRCAEENVRVHDAEQIAEYKRSVEMFGQIKPIVCDEDGMILAGNGLYEAMAALGRTDADCLVMEGLSEKEKIKLMVADNQIFNLGSTDMDALEKTLAAAMDSGEPALVIAHAPCRIAARLTKEGLCATDPGKCKACGACFKLGCPAIVRGEETAPGRFRSKIESSSCIGCNVCSQVCPFGAIHSTKEG